MDKVEGQSAVLNNSDWWTGVTEEDSVNSLTLEELWSSDFIPPPPHPHFLLDENAQPDGPTTCDLCTWAWEQRTSQTGDIEISWVVTLAIVSLISAAIGAIVMITVLHCRRKFRSGGVSGQSSSTSQISESREEVAKSTESSSADREATTWLGRQRPTLPAENHYVLEEGLYAELDRASTPAYRNAGYSDTEPSSSAYYSDLSAATSQDRAYEAIGLTEQGPTITVPSNYV